MIPEVNFVKDDFVEVQIMKVVIIIEKIVDVDDVLVDLVSVGDRIQDLQVDKVVVDFV